MSSSGSPPPDAPPGAASPPDTGLWRVLGVPGAVLLGLGSIVGTGIFVSVGTAAGVAGSSVVVAVALASVVAACNGLSSAQLATAHPVSGGTYAFSVLVYYAIANACALRQPREQRRFPRAVPVFLPRVVTRARVLGRAGALARRARADRGGRRRARSAQDLSAVTTFSIASLLSPNSIFVPGL